MPSEEQLLELERVGGLAPKEQDAVNQLRELKQFLDVICRPQKDQLAASVSNGNPDCNQLTQPEAVDVLDIRQIQHKVAMTFFEQFIDVFPQTDLKET